MTFDSSPVWKRGRFTDVSAMDSESAKWLKRTIGVHGFYGASSLERLPVEHAIATTLVLLICLTKVAKSAFDKALVEHEDIDDAVGSEEPTERDRGVDLQQSLLI
ncbi:hypothetical protein OROGR_026238 [Orobanche gracilis]